jgi:nucleoside 2-deoxyribosyltransferase
MIRKIFVSFSKKDYALARPMIEKLTSAGLEVYGTDLCEDGADVKRKITDGIQGSDAVVAVVSENSAHSPWLSYELGMAAATGKKFVPVNSGVERSQLPPVLRSLETVDLLGFEHYVDTLSVKL